MKKHVISNKDEVDQFFTKKEKKLVHWTIHFSLLTIIEKLTIEFKSKNTIQEIVVI